MTRGKRIAIVGGGPGGMSAALAFLQRGYDVTIFERYPEIKAAGSGLSLSTPPLLVLKQLGVDIEKLGAPARIGFSRWDGRPRAEFPIIPRLEQDFGASFFGLLRPDLYERMAAALPAGVLRPDHRCVGLEQDDRGAVVHFDNGTSFEADLVVGADGIHSVVRRFLWGDGPINYHGFVCWQGYCEYEGPDRSFGRICHNATTQASWGPILHQGREAWQWWILEPWPQGKPFTGDAMAHVSKLMGGWVDPLPALVAATDPSTLLRREIVDRPRLRRWSQGRVTLLGDAAHATSPYAAYGAGLAIEDGYYLARHVAGRDLTRISSVRNGLAAYEAQRERRTAATAGFARTLGKVFHRGGRPWQIFRDAMLDHTSIPEKLLVAGYTKALREELDYI